MWIPQYLSTSAPWCTIFWWLLPAGWCKLESSPGFLNLTELTGPNGPLSDQICLEEQHWVVVEQETNISQWICSKWVKLSCQYGPKCAAPWWIYATKNYSSSEGKNGVRSGATMVYLTKWQVSVFKNVTISVKQIKDQCECLVSYDYALSCYRPTVLKLL